MIIKLHDELILILIQSTIVSITACNYLLVILLFIQIMVFPIYRHSKFLFV